MKKIISVLLALAVVVCCCACGMSAFAVNDKEAAPALTLGAQIGISVPNTGNEEENAIYIAKFTPEESGWYEFVFDTEYTSTAPSAKAAANANLTVEDEEGSFNAMAMAIDLSVFDEQELEQIKENGIFDLKHIGMLACTANLDAGKTYYLDMLNTGLDSYSSNLVVNKHTHTLTTREVTGDKYAHDGKYESCDDWYCTYDEMIEPYTVTYELIEGAEQVIARGEDLAFTVNGSIDKFYDLYIDDEILTQGEDYSVKDGSTKVTVKADYLSNLEAGEHSVKFTYMDGEANTTFTLKTQTEQTGKTNTATTSPDTGDGAGLFFASGIMIAAGLGAYFSLKRKVW